MGESRMIVRKASEADLPSILMIYNEVISSSTAVYSDDPVPLDNRKAWFDRQEERKFPVLAAVHPDDGVVGFSAFGDWRGAWPGFRATLEQSRQCSPELRAARICPRFVQSPFYDAV